jgi:hypothetical protein
VPTVRANHATDFRLLGQPVDAQNAGEKRTDGPGSTGKKSPESFICPLRFIHDTAGWTTMSMLNWSPMSDPQSSKNKSSTGVLGFVKIQNFVHVCKIYAHTPERCRKISFQTRTAGKWDYKNYD